MVFICKLFAFIITYTSRIFEINLSSNYQERHRTETLLFYGSDPFGEVFKGGSVGNAVANNKAVRNAVVGGDGRPEFAGAGRIPQLDANLHVAHVDVFRAEVHAHRGGVELAERAIREAFYERCFCTCLLVANEQYLYLDNVSHQRKREEGRGRRRGREEENNEKVNLLIY